jgi:hypothetical protein
MNADGSISLRVEDIKRIHRALKYVPSSVQTWWTSHCSIGYVSRSLYGGSQNSIMPNAGNTNIDNALKSIQAEAENINNYYNSLYPYTIESITVIEKTPRVSRFNEFMAGNSKSIKTKVGILGDYDYKRLIEDIIYFKVLAKMYVSYDFNDKIYAQLMESKLLNIEYGLMMAMKDRKNAVYLVEKIAKETNFDALKGRLQQAIGKEYSRREQNTGARKGAKFQVQAGEAMTH